MGYQKFQGKKSKLLFIRNNKLLTEKIAAIKKVL